MCRQRLLWHYRTCVALDIKIYSPSTSHNSCESIPSTECSWKGQSMEDCCDVSEAVSKIPGSFKLMSSVLEHPQPVLCRLEHGPDAHAWKLSLQIVLASRNEQVVHAYRPLSGCEMHDVCARPSILTPLCHAGIACAYRIRWIMRRPRTSSTSPCCCR